MTAVNPDASSQQAVVEAALVLLERMGLSPADLTAVPQHRTPVPTFAEYVPVVSAAVSAGTRRAYGSYWNRVVEHWGGRRLDEPTPSQIRQLMAYVKTHVVARRNARGGRSAEEHLVAALRCLYQRAIDDGLIAEADNPARKTSDAVKLSSCLGKFFRSGGEGDVLVVVLSGGQAAVQASEEAAEQVALGGGVPVAGVFAAVVVGAGAG
jgi:hypothetical protein